MALPPAHLVRAELSKICNSACFEAAPQCQRFLEWLVEATLAQRPRTQKHIADALGLNDLDRARTLADRTRQRLEKYYGGNSAPFHFRIGKQRYKVDCPDWVPPASKMLGDPVAEGPPVDDS